MPMKKYKPEQIVTLPILPPTMVQRCCSVWAGPVRFSQQPPVVMPWGRLCPALQPAGNSSWSVYRRTLSN